MKSTAYPDFIGVISFKDGSYEVYPDLAFIPPSEAYVRLDKHEAKVAQHKQVIAELVALAEKMYMTGDFCVCGDPHNYHAVLTRAKALEVVE